MFIFVQVMLLDSLMSVPNVERGIGSSVTISAGFCLFRMHSGLSFCKRWGIYLQMLKLSSIDARLEVTQIYQGPSDWLVRTEVVHIAFLAI